MRACRWFTRRGPLSCPLLLDQNLYRKFVRDEEPPAEFSARLGQNRYYNVDLIPKFIMANGEWPLKHPVPSSRERCIRDNFLCLAGVVRMSAVVAGSRALSGSSKRACWCGAWWGACTVPAAVLVRWCTGSDR